MTIKAKKISTIICSLIILLSLYVTPVSAASGARGTICPGCSGICYQVELMEHGLLIKKLVLTAIHMVQIKWNSGPLQL